MDADIWAAPILIKIIGQIVIKIGGNLENQSICGLKYINMSVSN
jgi:hypothetical protein